MAGEQIDALRRALELSPDNHELRLLLAAALHADGQSADAAAEYRSLADAGLLPSERLVEAGRAALAGGDVALATWFADRAREAGVIEGVADLQRDVDVSLGVESIVRVAGASADPGAPPIEIERGAPTTFDDIGGLDEIKKAIHRTIVLPFRRPELYERYGRRAGGGVLLFGPPGCGKTMLARATAGECGLPFSNVRIEEILDPMFGISERNLHDVFVQARSAAPCVLFLDELDAIGFARRKHVGSAGRPLVDQVLQELDSIGSENEGILVLAATNAPWDVDEAIKRPGRFDRLLFVPPPDEPARRRILELNLRDRPVDRIDFDKLVKKTPLFSGADLRALVERALDAVIDEALDAGAEVLLGMQHLERALDGMRPTTLEWLATARNYVEFANESGRYNEVSRFLVSREAKAWRD